MGGYDTSVRVQDVWPAASKYGNPRYWLRYFANSPGATDLEGAAVSECRAIWNSGGHFLAPIEAPTQSRLSDGYSDGHANAQAFVSAMTTAYYDVGPLLVPNNNILYCWLDQEYGTSLSVSYWNGWATYPDGYNFGSLGTYPLYPCLYCSPQSPYPNCTTIGSSSAVHCFGVWTPEPQRCSNVLKNPPSWAAVTCSPYSSTPTILWQFHEDITADSCQLTVTVDCDLSTLNYPDYCFNVSSSP